MAVINISNLSICDIFVFLLEHNDAANFTNLTSTGANDANVSIPV